MKDLLVLLVHLLTTLARLLGPGGSRTILADSLLMKQQRLIINRSRKRATNLTVTDRLLLGFWSLFLGPRHIRRSAVIIKPSTLLKFHEALKKRKYQLIYSSRRKGKPGPKGPCDELILITVEMNSTMGTPTYLSSDNDPLFEYHRWQANPQILEIEEIKPVPYTPISHPYYRAAHRYRSP